MALRQTAATLAALLLVSNGATTLAVARRVRRGPPATSGAPNRQSAQTRIRAPASISHPLASSPQRAESRRTPRRADDVPAIGEKQVTQVSAWRTCYVVAAVLGADVDDGSQIKSGAALWRVPSEVLTTLLPRQAPPDGARRLGASWCL